MVNVDGSSQTKYYYYRDAQGSVVALLNENSDVVEGYTYGPYGQPTVHTAAGNDGIWLTSDDTLSQTAVSSYGNPYMFTARRLDDETGLYYYRARMYSPELGRFLQPDPLGYFDSMNLYQYCLNNSINRVDPTGMFLKSIIGGVIGAVGAALLPFVPLPISIGLIGVGTALAIWDLIDDPITDKTVKNCADKMKDRNKLIDEIANDYGNRLPPEKPNDDKKPK